MINVQKNYTKDMTLQNRKLSPPFDKLLID